MTEKNQLILELENLEKEAAKALAEVQKEQDLQSWHNQFLGRSGLLVEAFSRLPEVGKEERPVIGQLANKIKNGLESSYLARQAELKQAALLFSLEAEKLDISLPGRTPAHGRLHPQTQTLRRLRHFCRNGFSNLPVAGSGNR